MTDSEGKRVYGYLQRGEGLADLHLHTNMSFFEGWLWLNIAVPPEDTRKDSGPLQEDSLPSAGKHQHNTVTGT